MSYNRGWSTQPEPPKAPRREWVPVVSHEPVFSGPDEKRRYAQAVAADPWKPGEDPVEWVERVIAAATMDERQPGEEG